LINHFGTLGGPPRVPEWLINSGLGGHSRGSTGSDSIARIAKTTS